MNKQALDQFMESKNQVITIDDLSKVQKGDMPGDKIHINESHMRKAEIIFPKLVEYIKEHASDLGEKVVISVYGGSGVGKSEIGSLLAHYFKSIGIGSYVLSGDNYPHRIPEENDAMRLETYETKGREALADYLAGPSEIEFELINQVIKQFKEGQSSIALKRMGRTKDSIRFEEIDMSQVDVLVLEWTHGNNPNLKGVDLPIFLNSTPAETLAHRRERNRDGNLDSPFTMMVLAIEQSKLVDQASSAWKIISKQGDMISYREFRKLLNEDGPMINAYPDSIGGNLASFIDFLKEPDLKDVFSSFYILPSVFNTDLDRGFSVIDYDLDEEYASQADINALDDLDIDIKLDFVLNHKSVLSKEFQDIINKGRESEYFDFFIDWNKFWQGNGELSDEGHIIPKDAYLDKMFFRKPGLPILSVVLPDGSSVPFWNTFYQEVKYRSLEPQDFMEVLEVQYTSAKKLSDGINEHLSLGKKINDYNFGKFSKYKDKCILLAEKNRLYLGQMDLNVDSPIVWEFYEDTLKKLASYGARIVRLDAFAYAAKAVGEKNFFNEPGTWEILARLDDMAKKYGLELLPEIHTRYEEKVHEVISEKGYRTYDFFLPGLIIDAFRRQTFEKLVFWIKDMQAKGIKTVNMLGCHDGIPLLDLKGILEDDLIEDLIETVVSRGGLVKDLHGKKNMYYQVNATYYSAIGEDDQKMLLARALQMFVPGKPQVWYLDLLAGKNDYEAVKKGGSGSHKEINRTNLAYDEALSSLQKNVVKEQLDLIRLRNTHPAFGQGAIVDVECDNKMVMSIKWTSGVHEAVLEANLSDYTYKILTS